MGNEIILSDERTKLLEEIKRLRTQLAALIQTKEQLEYYICPELGARWASEFGEMKNRIYHQQLSILELKRRIEIMRAALNREKTVSQEDVDQKVNEEYQDYEQKVDEEYQKAKDAEENQKQREADRRQYRNQWKQQFSTDGDGGESSEGKDKDDNSDQQEKEYQEDDPFEEDKIGEDGQGGSEGDNGSDERQQSDKKDEPTTAKSLFRSIVKRLHPDMNPNQTQHEKNLFNKAVEAYQNGDMVTLQNIYDEITVGKEDSGEADESNLSIEELIKIRDRLAKRIDELSSELDEIRSVEPYTYKEILDDPDRLAQAKSELEAEFEDNKVEIDRLSQLLSEVEQEMEELKKKKGKQ